MRLPAQVAAHRAHQAALRKLPPPAARRRIRLDAGVSQDRLGAELGVTGPTIHAWETGKYSPSPDRVAPYARLLKQLAEAADDTEGTTP